MGVTPYMKISEVLKEYPQLLDVLVQQSPHFSRLKNPILRRIQGRLVTVAQAAAIGGIDAAQLVRTLNRAIGEDDAYVAPVVVESVAAVPPPPWMETATVAVAVDVRESQQRKEDPFAIIMAAVAKVKDGEILSLRNTFEPFPLYDVLGKRGFVAWSRQLGKEDWEVFFFKTAAQADAARQVPSPDVAGRSVSAPTSVAVDTAVSAATEAAATLTVDVRELVPPQPMMRILEALDRLNPGETLLVHHVRRPVYLYPRLEEMGYGHETRELGPDRVDIYVRKR